MSQTDPPPGGGISLSARLDRIPVLTGQHRVWLVLLAALYLFDMADLNAFALVAPTIREQWNLSLSEVALITSASFVGMLFGAIVGGRLADRFGRKRVILGSVVLYSAASVASAFASGVVDLCAYRVLIGVGLQAMTVVLATFVAEMYPKRMRGRALAGVMAFGLLGIPAMAGFARLVVPLGDTGWRWVFVLGAGGLLVALVGLWLLPESVRWTSTHRPTRAAEAVVARLEDDARRRTGTELPPAEPLAPPVTGSPRELIRPPLRRRLAVLLSYMIIVTAAGYGFNAWLPTLLVENGYTTAQSLSFTTTIALAACPGAVLASLFVDRIERRTAMLAANTTLGVLMLVFAFTPGYGALLGCGFLIILTTYAGAVCTNIYIPEVFPTGLRGLGTGIASGTGRFAVVGSSFLIAWALAGLGVQAVFICLGIASFAGALVIGLFGERTRNRALEAISEQVVLQADPDAAPQSAPLVTAPEEG